MRSTVSILEWAVLRFVHQFLKKLGINFAGELKVSSEDGQHVIVYMGYMTVMVLMQAEFGHYTARGLVNISFDDGIHDNYWGMNWYISDYDSTTSTYKFRKTPTKGL